MTVEAATALIEILAINLDAAADIRNRLAALKKTLSENQRALYTSGAGILGVLGRCLSQFSSAFAEEILDFTPFRD